MTETRVNTANSFMKLTYTCRRSHKKKVTTKLVVTLWTAVPTALSKLCSPRYFARTSSTGTREFDCFLPDPF
jgi:hypothetical protein